MYGIVEKFRPSTSEVMFEEPVPDFIPYACHYDKDTILTKNGELLQVIKLVGFSGEVVGAQQVELRDVVRQAIVKHIKDNNIALWLHTIRCKTNLDPGGYFSNEFSYRLNQAWNAHHQWDKKYVNELYITVIHEGVMVKTKDIKALLKALSFKSLKKHHQKALDKAHQELATIVDNMLMTLKNFGARRLTIIEENSGFYSEHLQFFGRILNLSDIPAPIPVNDLSHYLASHKIAFGFNTMEVRGQGGTKFAAIFTIKDSPEMPTEALDKFLQLPQEFIILQTLDFINSKSALSYFKEQYSIFKISGALQLAELSGIEAIVSNTTGSVTDFGESQLTMLLISDTVANLVKDIEQASDVLNQLGILVTRRDLRLEECFWAQLPANFAFLSRCKPINTLRVGGFASLYNFPAGKHKNNHWGPAVTAFHTVSGTPYFFNFHINDCGHTSIVGPYGSGKTVLLNFLISEARKYNGRLFFFDHRRASQVFIRSIGGEYTVINPNAVSPEYSFNPLQLLSVYDNDETRDFLTYWLVLLAQAQGDVVDDREHHELALTINHMATLPPAKRTLHMLVQHLEQQGESRLVDTLSIWHTKGKYAHLFDNSTLDANPLKNSIYGFGVNLVIDDSTTLGPILAYLLYCIELTLDGTPAVVVLDEAWKLVDNALFAPLLSGWLDRLKEKNAIVIFATETVNNASRSEINKIIIDRIATQIFLPNAKAEESSIAYQKIWGLTEEEFSTLSEMKAEKRQFMLRQQGTSVIAVLDLAKLKEIDILSGSDKSVAVMDSAIEKAGPSPEEWLPVFYEMIKQR